MVEKVSNIGQLLMQAGYPSQAAPGKGLNSKNDLFSICEDDGLLRKKAGDIRKPDNTDKNTTNKDGKYFVQKKSDADNKKVSRNRDGKIKSSDNRKREITDFRKSEAKPENTQPENDNVIGSSEYVVEDTPDNAPSQEGSSPKSEQIIALHDTESRKPGIKTIIPEKSNGENSLKNTAVTTNTDSTNPGKILSEKDVTLENADQSANEKATKAISENHPEQTNKLGKDNEDIENIISGRKTLAETLIKAGNKNADDDANISKADILNNHNKGIIQTQEIPKSVTQESLDSQNRQNSETAGSDKNLSEVTQAGKQLFNKASGNPDEAVKNVPEFVHIVTHEVKVKGKNESVTDNSKTNIDQIFSSTDTNQAGKTSAIAAAKTNPGIMRDNPQGDISAQISRQITESIHNSSTQQTGDRQITVRLNPPELGSVVVKFSEQSGQLTGILEVSKSQTRIEIEHALPHIMRTLSDSGIQLKKIDVVSSDTTHANNDSMNEHLPWSDNSDQSAQYGSSNQHAGASDFNNSGFHQWFSNTIEYHRGYRHEAAFASSRSINMLA